ncbi:cell filamentation protein Fic [Specibacter cremeus]|uniref:cell filamentation protein Fic n=1 Tax=Specibacter cremeus TaxID=1629051 RepID=UPI000F79A183|nr:cell filamentation protein Fic [Specibacter cremeus]
MGFSWDSAAIDWNLLPTMPVPRAVARFEGQLAGHVWDAAALEGNPYTLPEVQTLLDGVTVGGHRLEDERQVLALAESTRTVRDLVRDGGYTVGKEISDRLHGIVAPHEAIEAGHFRGEGRARGGGTVNLGEYGVFTATGCEDSGAALRTEYRQGTNLLSALEHPVERAVAYFCFGTRHQFYFDGNKRTSRLMMNGQLMMAGRDAISIPYLRRLEFNEHLITLYLDADATALMKFIVDCRPAP